MLNAHRHIDRLSRWIIQLQTHVGYFKTLVAIANKHARILWAVPAKGEKFDAARVAVHTVHGPTHHAAKPALTCNLFPTHRRRTQHARIATGQIASRRTRTRVRRYILCSGRVLDAGLLRGYYPCPGQAPPPAKAAYRHAVCLAVSCNHVPNLRNHSMNQITLAGEVLLGGCSPVKRTFRPSRQSTLTRVIVDPTFVDEDGRQTRSQLAQRQA
jgi:hypothetical protein